MSFPPKHTSPVEVQYTIFKLPCKKSPGYDLITSEILKQLPQEVCPNNLYIQLNAPTILLLYSMGVLLYHTYSQTKKTT
jgi:hypothetical protein